MRDSICAVILIGVSACAQDEAAASAGHGKGGEDGEPVGYPLKGWFGYTNTGESVSDITVQALTSPDKPPEATGNSA